MKKYVAFSLAFILILCLQNTFADTLNIDLDNASYDEVVEAINTLKAVRLKMVTEQFANSHSRNSSDGISFRKIPWGSTRAEAEEIVGKANSTDRRYILNTISGRHRNGLGLQDQYKDWVVAGYPVEYSSLYYVFPVVDDILIRDDSLSQFYLAQYRFPNLGDVNAAVSDISEKLKSLYGEYKIGTYGEFIWSDKDGNTLVLESHPDISLMYYAANAEELIAAAKRAVDLENAEQEEMVRMQNQGNTDGL